MFDKFSVEYIQHCGSDLMHANSARVSFGKRSDWDYSTGQPKLKVADERLLKFLARGIKSDDWEKYLDEIESQDREGIQRLVWAFKDQGEHKSPFNHSFMTVHVKAPISVARQLVKHQFMIWNEVSGRYIQFNRDDVYIPEEYRAKAVDKKQGSGGAITGQAHDDLQVVFLNNSENAFNDYEKALSLGLCEEQARNLLPIGLMTEWYWSGTFYSWASMLHKRLAPDAQLESRVVAQKVAFLLKEHFPVSYDVMVNRDF